MVERVPEVVLTSQQMERGGHHDQIQFYFEQYLSMNSFLGQHKLEDVLAIQKQLEGFGVALKKSLRPEQVVTLALLILSQKQTTLIQLATSFGKSTMIGVLAEYLVKTTDNKVIVVVPTKFLQLYQSRHYCPSASKISVDINDATVVNVLYYTHKDFILLDPVVLASAIILVDEFHEVFFNYPLDVADGRLISVISQLAASKKIIGLSATFRGDAGIKRIQNMLKDSLFLTTPKSLKEKQLEFQIFGQLDPTATKMKVTMIVIEKSQEMPVIIFCEDTFALQEWKKYFTEAYIFAGDDNQLLDRLDQFKSISSGIVLTIFCACKGVDFLFDAAQVFIIYLVLPQTWIQLQQTSYRGVRDWQNLPAVGAIFTGKPYNNIDQVKKALIFSERFEKLYPVDYLASIEYLQKYTANGNPNILKKGVNMLNKGRCTDEIKKAMDALENFQPIGGYTNTDSDSDSDSEEEFKSNEFV